jgi:hypothetical protein
MAKRAKSDLLPVRGSKRPSKGSPKPKLQGSQKRQPPGSPNRRSQREAPPTQIYDPNQTEDAAAAGAEVQRQGKQKQMRVGDIADIGYARRTLDAVLQGATTLGEAMARIAVFLVKLAKSGVDTVSASVAALGLLEAAKSTFMKLGRVGVSIVTTLPKAAGELVAIFGKTMVVAGRGLSTGWGQFIQGLLNAREAAAGGAERIWLGAVAMISRAVGGDDATTVGGNTPFAAYKQEQVEHTAAESIEQPDKGLASATKVANQSGSLKTVAGYLTAAALVAGAAAGTMYLTGVTPTSVLESLPDISGVPDSVMEVWNSLPSAGDYVADSAAGLAESVTSLKTGLLGLAGYPPELTYYEQLMNAASSVVPAAAALTPALLATAAVAAPIPIAGGLAVGGLAGAGTIAGLMRGG